MNRVKYLPMLFFITTFSLFASGIEYGVSIGFGGSAIFKLKPPSGVEKLGDFKSGYYSTVPEMGALIQLGYFMDINDKQTFSFLSDLGFLYANGYSYKIQTYNTTNELGATVINKYYYAGFGMPSFSGGVLFRYTIKDISLALGSGVIAAQNQLGYVKLIAEYNISALKSANTVLGVYVRSDFSPKYGYTIFGFGLNVGLRFGGRPKIVEEARIYRESVRMTNETLRL